MSTQEPSPPEREEPPQHREHGDFNLLVAFGRIHPVGMVCQDCGARFKITEE